MSVFILLEMSSAIGNGLHCLVCFDQSFFFVLVVVLVVPVFFCFYRP